MSRALITAPLLTVAEPALSLDQVGLPDAAVPPGRVVWVMGTPLTRLEQLVPLRVVVAGGGGLRLHPTLRRQLGSAARVVVPRGEAARAEARAMLGTRRSSRDGTPRMPQGCALWGLYRASCAPPAPTASGVFSGPEEVAVAYELGLLDLHSSVVVRLEGGPVTTRVGRALLFALLPPGLEFALVDRVLDVRALRKLHKAAACALPPGALDRFLDRLAAFGRQLADASGYSPAMGDLHPPDRDAVFAAARESTRETVSMREDGLITLPEERNKIIDIWAFARERVRQALWKQADERAGLGGVRGAMEAYSNRQDWLCMVGAAPLSLSCPSLTVDTVASGRSAAGAWEDLRRRRTRLLAALPRAGQHRKLLRRLLRALGGTFITTDDCGTTTSHPVHAHVSGSRYALYPVGFGYRLTGRTLAQAVQTPEGEHPAGALITPALSEAISRSDLLEVPVRWAVDCAAPSGICAMCYGADPRTGRRVAVGQDVGTLAAMALAETAVRATGWTRLNFPPPRISARRSIHHAVSQAAGTVRLVRITPIETERGVVAFTGMRTVGCIEIVDEGVVVDRWVVSSGDAVHVADGERVRARHSLATRSHLGEVLVNLPDWSSGARVELHLQARQHIDDITGRSLVLAQGEGHIRLIERGTATPRILTVPVYAGESLYVDEGQTVKTGDRLLAGGAAWGRSRDLDYGGFQTITDLLEARRPTPAAPVAPIDGTVWLRDDRIVIAGFDGEERTLPWPAQPERLLAESGAVVEAGDRLTDDLADHRDLLAALGRSRFAAHLVDELHRLSFHDGAWLVRSHLEVVVRAMLQDGLRGISDLSALA